MLVDGINDLCMCRVDDGQVRLLDPPVGDMLEYVTALVSSIEDWKIDTFVR